MDITDFKFLDDQNNSLRVVLGVNTSPFPIVEEFPDGSYRREYLKGRRRGMKWKNNGKEVIYYLDEYVIGYPSADMNSVIAIFGLSNAKYPAPSNAVVLNSDGSVRLQLHPPELISKIALERMSPEEIKERSDLWFIQAGWNIDDTGSVVTSVWIGFDREWFEERVLDPVSGEFGACLMSGRI